MIVENLVFAMVSGVAIAGGVVTVFARDVTRMLIGLTGFFLALTAFFVYWGLTFLAVTQVFVYVGGVLVLFVFAIMLVHRQVNGSPRLSTRHDIAALTIAGGVFLLVVTAFSAVGPDALRAGADTTPGALSALVLGPMVTHLVMTGVLLFTVLVAVVVMLGGGKR